ncbi:MAG: DUF11 domain-containing protein [Saprospiraceae bacterium]|nr:DUF11 domain-containing protein [Saprospiraceae bacterium]
MKRLSILYYFLCFASTLLTAQNAYWEAAVGPYGGNVNIIPTSGNVTYALHSQGFYYRSEDFGEHWSQINVQPADPEAYNEERHIGLSGTFYSIALKQFGIQWKRQLYRSVDDGATWELRNADIPLLQIWETPSSALIGYDYENKLYRSTDGGINWQNVASLEITLSPYIAYMSFGENGKILLTGQDGSLMYSLNDGQIWYTGGFWGAALYAEVKMVPSGTLFRLNSEISGNPTLIYWSTNWGLLWTSSVIDLEDDEFPNSVVGLPSGRLLLATTKHIYFSDDQGQHWERQSYSPEQVTTFFSNAALPNGHLIGAFKGSAFRSSDGGASWTFSAYGMQLAVTKQLELLDDSLQLALTPNGLWRSADAGDTWSRLVTDTTAQYVYNTHPIAALNADSFAVSFGTKAWRTVDAGQHFVDITPPNSLYRGHIFAGKGGRLFATDPSGVLMSVDFGLSWQSLFPGESLQKLEQHPNGTLFAIAASLPDEYDNQLRRSTDGGTTWEPVAVTGILPTSSLFDMVINSQGDLYLLGFSGQSLRLARSSDLGENWTYEVVPDVYSNGPLAVNTLGHIFTPAGQNHNIFTSVDAGQSWYFLPPFTESASILFGLEISPSGHLYVVPASGPIYRTSQSTQIGGYIRGHVFRDADGECSTPDAQEPLKNWIVEISGPQQFVVSTAPSGLYSVFTDAGTYELHARVPQSLWWRMCDSLQVVQLDSAQTVIVPDFVAIAASECPLMTVDVEIPLLRRCFDNPVYVAYCNAGTQSADSAWVEVLLDPQLSFVGSQQPYEALGGNFYRFLLGDVAWGDCGQFYFTVHVACDSTVLGQTHCITAHGFPDTLCNLVPSWSGATIEAKAVCQDSLVQLKLHNVGTNPSTTLNYIIIEDDVVLLQGQKQYDIAESITLDYAANGRTWRIESQQEPGHPFSNVALAFLEGCGGYQSLGYVNRFSVNGWEPSIDRVCAENVGAYDPNDKQGFPLGYGSDHRIRPGQQLEYLIRFQNTGTDTAFTVQVRDTLSPWLDPGTLRAGAASHPYTWSLSSSGVLSFKFDNIMLPDSNVNLSGSQGFVSFQIGQRAGVPLETQILNSAAIYFDFNEPVITNQTLHTVGIDYITAVQDAWGEETTPTIGVQPNPALYETLLQLPEGVERLTLWDALGRPVRSIRVRATQYRLDRENLPSGVYWLRAEDRKGNMVGNGKVVWR